MNASTAQKPKCSKALAALIACIIPVPGLIWYCVRGRYFIYDLQRHIHLGVEKPGVSLDIVELQNTIFSGLQGHCCPSLTAIRVQTPNRVFWLHSPGELQGDVTIRTPDDALNYVQLFTTDDAFYAGISNALEVSCLDPSNEKSGPDQGIESKSGFDAMVKSADYKADGFTPPTVSQSGHVFHIRRWVWITSLKSGNVQLWDESVAPDGAYACRILLSKPAPTSHGEEWAYPCLK